MDEGELLALLTGTRKSPIHVCYVSGRLSRALGSSTTAVWLSAQTTKKLEAKHRASNKNLYAKAPAILESRFIRIEIATKRMIFILHEPKDESGKIRSYKAVIKTTRNGQELYLLSVHRTDPTGVRAIFKRTVSLQEWERK